MRDFLEQLLTRWDAQTSPGGSWSIYNVTPRHGRHTVERKLLRQLQRRFTLALAPVPVSTSLKP